MSSAYLRLFIFLPAILIPACCSFSQRFSWCTLHISWISRVTIYSLMNSFSYLEPVCCSMSSSNYNFLNCIQVSQEAGQVVWYSHLLKNFQQFMVIHTVKGFGIVNKAEIDVFLELSCFFNYPVGLGNLISGSIAFPKTSLNIWKFMVHVLLKPGLENFEHYVARVWDECNCAVVWAFFGTAFFGNGMTNDLLQSCSLCWILQICWHIECSTFMASSVRIWNSSTGIPSPPLVLFVEMLPKAHWLRIPGCLALGEQSHYRDYLGLEDLFVQFCVFLPPLNIFCFC